ncbi:hypothetical protein Hanom_Chr16g01418401 [Helianthus anomalus]
MIGQSNPPSALFKKRQTQNQARSRPITPRGAGGGRYLAFFGQFKKKPAHYGCLRVWSCPKLLSLYLF